MHERLYRRADLCFRAAIVILTLHILFVCPSDLKLQSAICKKLSLYRRHCLRPAVALLRRTLRRVWFTAAQPSYRSLRTGFSAFTRYAYNVSHGIQARNTFRDVTHPDHSHQVPRAWHEDVDKEVS